MRMEGGSKSDPFGVREKVMKVSEYDLVCIVDHLGVTNDSNSIGTGQ